MANKKKPFAVFETKEQFDARFDDVYEAGRETGFKEGKAWVLSYMYDLFDYIFSNEDQYRARLEMKSRHIEEWRKEKEIKTMKDKLDLRRLIHAVGEEARKEFAGDKG